MSIIRLQSETEKQKGLCYQFNTEDPPIGIGGMGKVYKGVCINENTGTTQPVAIKFMYDDLPAHAYERARRESEIQLRNDNLVAMMGFIETQDRLSNGEIRKHYHVVSELLTGVSLSDLLEGKTKDRNGVEIPFAVKMLQDYKQDPEHFAQFVVKNVLSGVMALHDAGYIHRDIDPSNIMLTSDGHIKLIDFGIAKQMNTLTTNDKSLTVAGKFMGKPEYAAPELALGDINHQNQTTDIYAIGILLYQCIVGHTPFEGSRYDILDKQLKEKIPLENISNKVLRKIIATACEKKQDRRYQSAAQMRVALESDISYSDNSSLLTKICLGVICLAVFVAFFMFGLQFLPSESVEDQNEQQMEYTFDNSQTSQSEGNLNNTASSKGSDREKVQAQLNKMMDEAESLLELGCSMKDEDHYEQQLMEAHTLYVLAKDFAQELSDQSRLTIIESKCKKAIDALNAAQVSLSDAANELENLGEQSIAKNLRDRASAIVDFKNKQK